MNGYASGMAAGCAFPDGVSIGITRGRLHIVQGCRCRSRQRTADSLDSAIPRGFEYVDELHGVPEVPQVLPDTAQEVREAQARPREAHVVPVVQGSHAAYREVLR